MTVDDGRDSVPGLRSKILRLRQNQVSLQRPGDNGGRQRMLAELFDTGCQTQDLIIRGRDQLRLALRQRAGFVDHQRVHFLRAASSASAFRISTPAVAPRPVPTMIDIGVANPNAHGHAMISTATAFTSAYASRGCGPIRCPNDERHDSDADHGRHEHRPIHDRPAAESARAIAALRSPSCTMRASMVSAPTRSARMANAPVPLIVPPVTRAPGSFLHRNRLAGDHRFVDRTRALDHHAVHRNALARTHAQHVAGMHVIERDIFFRAAGTNHAARSWAPSRAKP